MTYVRISCLMTLTAIGLTVSVVGHSETLHRYSVEIDEELRTLAVTACFEPPLPQRLSTYDSNAHRFARDAQLVTDDETEELRIDRRGIRLDQKSDNVCVSYTVDIDQAVEHRARTSRRDRAPSDDLLTSPSMWLWRARSLPADTDIEIRFVLPDGISVSAPWRLIERTPRETIYRTGRTPASWQSRVALGRFTVQQVTVPGAQLRLAVIDGTPAADPEAMERWIGEAATAVSTLYGRFPLDSTQVLVVPYGAGNEPVPWGQVHRGGGAAIFFVVNQTYPLHEFRDDWTATHEFSHLLLPYVNRRDAWLSEGIASYYQNVLRARAGMLSQTLAWQKLYEGFERGVRENGREKLTLSEASTTMHSRGNYMRVYWSGAAIALLADVELRRRSNGQKSMDTVLSELQQCCLPAARRWGGSELFDRLDELATETIFGELYSEYMHSRQFPDVTDTFAELGVSVNRGRVTLKENAPLAETRNAIMRAP